MRSVTFAAMLILAALLLQAQQPQAPKLFSSASDVTELIAKAKGQSEARPLVSERILSLAPYNANLEYRTAIAPPTIHETQAEVFYVIDGSATMVTGGKLVNEKRTNASNLSGTAIEGGNSREISKGDFIMVPEGTPHGFSKINGTLVLMTLHVPHPVPGR